MQCALPVRPTTYLVYRQQVACWDCAGIVHQDINRAPTTIVQLRPELGHAARRRQIHRVDVAPRRRVGHRELGLQLPQVRLSARDEVHVGALCGELPRDCRADALGCASDHDDLAVELEADPLRCGGQGRRAVPPDLARAPRR